MSIIALGSDSGYTHTVYQCFMQRLQEFIEGVKLGITNKDFSPEDD